MMEVAHTGRLAVKESGPDARGTRTGGSGNRAPGRAPGRRKRRAAGLPRLAQREDIRM